MIWLLPAALTSVVLLILLGPLIQRRRTRQDPQLADLYRAELAELAAEQANGRLSADAASRARIEIERRFLATAKDPSEPVASSGRSGFIVLALGLIASPVLAIVIYLALGVPGEPDRPLAARGAELALLAPDGQLDQDKARLAILDRLKTDQDNPEGWHLLARTDLTLGRADEAKAAFTKALALSARPPALLEEAGQALVELAGGDVTADAEAMFAEAAGKDQHAWTARYFLGLAQLQRGDAGAAVAAWRRIAQDAPSDAPFQETLRRAITTAAGTPTGQASAPPPTKSSAPPEFAGILALPPDERQAAIESMVAALAARLEQTPDDLAGWRRLGRSELVLGRAKDAAQAYGHVLERAPSDLDAAIGRARALAQHDGRGQPIGAETIAAWQRVAALSPDQPEALLALGLAAQEHGDTAERDRLWTELKSTAPQSAEASLISGLRR